MFYYCIGIACLAQTLSTTIAGRYSYFFFPLLVALLLLVLTMGPQIANPVFWNNLGEFINYFLSGFGLEPMYKTLLDHKYLESLLGFILPMGYVLTLLILLSRLVI